MCYCPTPTLHLNLALTGDCAFQLSPKKPHSVWFISVLKSGDMGQCPEKSPSPCNTCVIPVSLYKSMSWFVTKMRTHTHTHTHTHARAHSRHLGFYTAVLNNRHQQTPSYMIRNKTSWHVTQKIHGNIITVELLRFFFGLSHGLVLTLETDQTDSQQPSLALYGSAL